MPLKINSIDSCDVLKDYIKKIVVIESRKTDDSDKGYIFNYYPDECITLFFSAGYFYAFYDGRINRLEKEKAYVKGQTFEVSRFDVDPDALVLEVSIMPWAVDRLIGFDTSDLAGKIVPLTGLPHWEDGRFEKKVVGALKKDVEEAIRLIEDEFGRLLAGSQNKSEPLLRRAVELIEKSSGRIEISELASELAVSVRSLQMTFKKYVGLSPKTLANIYKLNTLYQELLTSGDQTRLAQFTYELGFADQSHLSKQFKSYMKTSPLKFVNYIREKHYVEELGKPIGRKKHKIFIASEIKDRVKVD